MRGSSWLKGNDVKIIMSYQLAALDQTNLLTDSVYFIVMYSMCFTIYSIHMFLLRTSCVNVQISTILEDGHSA
jgi:hypothetical protein